MQAKQVLAIYSEIKKSPRPRFTKIRKLRSQTKNKMRPNSVSVTDVFFGDSGKGSVIAKLNAIYSNKKKNKSGKLYSLRFNGGANAGHETMFYGKKVVTHQVPVAVIEEAATALITRSVLLHPEDFVTEINQIQKLFGGKLPGNLYIDERTILGLDTHRAFEWALNKETTGGRGSTGRGISPGYASFYLRIPVTVRDLLSENWKQIFREHYRLYSKMTAGFLDKRELANIEVAKLGEEKLEKRPLGSEAEFLRRLGATREILQPFVVDNMYDIIQDMWSDKNIPVTIEGAQGAGIDPYNGIYPDITASRPLTRLIRDGTYNIISLEQIAFSTAAMKTTYFSSVGSRQLPLDKDGESMQWIQTAFDERGRSTGRLRDVYPISIPLAKAFKEADGYEYIMATHLDAAKKDKKIAVVTHYVDKKTGKEIMFQPYQDAVDQLEPHIVFFDGWDGELIKQAKTPEQLPLEAKRFLTFLSKTIGPIMLGTTGPDVDQYISWTDAI